MEEGYSRPKIEDMYIGFEYEWCGTSLQWLMLNPCEPEEHMKPLTELHDIWTKKVIKDDEDLKWVKDLIEGNGMIRIKNNSIDELIKAEKDGNKNMDQR